MTRSQQVSSESDLAADGGEPAASETLGADGGAGGGDGGGPDPSGSDPGSPDHGGRRARASDRSVPGVGVGLRIARCRLRRNVRKVPEEDVYVASLLVGLLGVAIVLPLVYDASHAAGAALAGGDAGPLAVWWDAAALGWLGVALYAVVLGIGSEGEPEHGALLAIRPAEDVMAGLTVLAMAWTILFVAPIVGVAVAGLCIGLGSALPLLGAALALALGVVTATSVGYPIGVGIKGVIRTTPALEEHKTLLAVLAAVGYVWSVGTGALVPVVDAVAPVVLDSPLSWLGDLALATTPDAGSDPLRAVGAIVASLALLPVAILAGGRPARYAWHADRARSVESDDAGATAGEDAAGPTIGDRFSLIVERLLGSRAIAGVATVALRRAYREPFQLLFAAIPLLGAIPVFDALLETGTLPWWTPWVVIAYGAWFAGAAFPLNVLGVQGAALPAVLVSRARGRDVVAGTVIGASAVAAPLTAVLAVAAGVAAGRSPTALLAIAAAAIGAVTAASVFATGIGCLAPRLESVELSTGRAVPLPSKTAYAAFSTTLLVAVGTTAALTEEPARLILAVLLNRHLPFGLAVTAAELRTIATIAVPLIAVAVPLSFLIAARRIERYTVA